MLGVEALMKLKTIIHRKVDEDRRVMYTDRIFGNYTSPVEKTLLEVTYEIDDLIKELEPLDRFVL